MEIGGTPRALTLDTVMGSLSAAFKADITVIARQDSDASENLLKTHLAEGQMARLAVSFSATGPSSKR